MRKGLPLSSFIRLAFGVPGMIDTLPDGPRVMFIRAPALS